MKKVCVKKYASTLFLRPRRHEMHKEDVILQKEPNSLSLIMASGLLKWRKTLFICAIISRLWFSTSSLSLKSCRRTWSRWGQDVTYSSITCVASYWENRKTDLRLMPPQCKKEKYIRLVLLALNEIRDMKSYSKLIAWIWKFLHGTTGRARPTKLYRQHICQTA